MMQYPPDDNPQQYPPQPNTQYPPQQPSQPLYPSYQPQAMYQPPPPKRRSHLALWIILGVVGVLLLGCCGVFVLFGTAIKNATTGTISPPSPTVNTTPSSNNQVANVGQTITIDGYSCTLVYVKTLAADEFTKPKAGNEFIVVHVKLHNAGSGEEDYNPFDFHVKSGAGNITNEEFVSPQSYTTNNVLNSGKLSQGGTVEGDIVFQVPKGDHHAQLTWQPSFFGNAGTNAWNLGL